jgi:hypothetical protein
MRKSLGAGGDAGARMLCILDDELLAAVRDATRDSRVLIRRMELDQLREEGRPQLETRPDVVVVDPGVAVDSGPELWHQIAQLLNDAPRAVVFTRPTAGSLRASLHCRAMLDHAALVVHGIEGPEELLSEISPSQSGVSPRLSRDQVVRGRLLGRSLRILWADPLHTSPKLISHSLGAARRSIDRCFGARALPTPAVLIRFSLQSWIALRVSQGATHNTIAREHGQLSVRSVGRMACGNHP